jgi:hypothetical protein
VGISFVLNILRTGRQPGEMNPGQIRGHDGRQGGPAAYRHRMPHGLIHNSQSPTSMVVDPIKTSAVVDGVKNTVHKAQSGDIAAQATCDRNR